MPHVIMAASSITNRSLFIVNTGVSCFYAHRKVSEAERSLEAHLSCFNNIIDSEKALIEILNK